jgi:hypothetical protein
MIPVIRNGQEYDFIRKTLGWVSNWVASFQVVQGADARSRNSES